MIPMSEGHGPQSGSTKPSGDAGGVHSIIQADTASRRGLILVLYSQGESDVSSTSQPQMLSTAARWLVGVIGVALIAASALLVYFPPAPSSVERNAEDEQVKRISVPTDLSSVFVTIVLSGAGLLLFAVNGYKFTRFSAAGVTADSEAVAAEAKKQLSASADDTQKIEIDKTSEPEPKPTQPPATTVDAQDEAYAVYTLVDVPAQVVQDALSGWPNEHRRPSTLAEFEFASRKRGKGNHAWQIKFRGSPPVVVTYGGFAKGEPTVRPG